MFTSGPFVDHLPDLCFFSWVLAWFLGGWRRVRCLRFRPHLGVHFLIWILFLCGDIRTVVFNIIWESQWLCDVGEIRHWTVHTPEHILISYNPCSNMRGGGDVFIPINVILNWMCVYPLEVPVIVDHWVGSRSWPTLSSVWFECPPPLHHRLYHRKELASPPVHWPPRHKINTQFSTQTVKTRQVGRINTVIMALHEVAKWKISAGFSLQILHCLFIILWKFKWMITCHGRSKLPCVLYYLLKTKHCWIKKIPTKIWDVPTCAHL